MKIEVSTGEVFDKISILNIKLLKISDPIKNEHIQNELKHLKLVLSSENVSYVLDTQQYNKLYETNLELWNMEDDIREKEQKKEFDNDFINIARSIYRLNDLRFIYKHNINQMTNSNFFEQKSHESCSE